MEDNIDPAFGLTLATFLFVLVLVRIAMDLRRAKLMRDIDKLLPEGYKTEGEILQKINGVWKPAPIRTLEWMLAELKKEQDQ